MNNNKLNILTLKFGDKYSSTDVNRLYSGLRDNSTVDFDFYCYTENASGLDENIIHIPLVMEIKTHWRKLEFHKRGFLPEGSKCLILDIDQVVVGDIDELLNYDLKPNTLVVPFRWWSDRANLCPVNGGAQMFYNGDTDHIWQTYYKDMFYWLSYYYNKGLASPKGMGEQNFLYEHHSPCELDFFPRKWFAKITHDKGMHDSFIDRWSTVVDPYDPYILGNELNYDIKIAHCATIRDDDHNPIDKIEWIKHD